MKLLKSAFIVAALALASPVWADGGHGHKRHGHHHGWDDRRGHAEWKHHRHHRNHGRHVDRRVILSQQYYYPAYPVYAAPAPGVHIVVPNIYIPLR